MQSMTSGVHVATGTPKHDLGASAEDRSPSCRAWPAIAAALILLGASLLKAWPIPTSMWEDGSGLSASMVLVACEVALGVWLLIGWRRSWAIGMAAGAFTVFLGYATYLALTGASSCGCFGAVQINPWWTAGLDATMVAALVMASPWLGRSSFSKVLAGVLIAGAMGTGATLAAVHGSVRVRDPGDLLGDQSYALLEPGQWIGKRLPLIPHMKVRTAVDKGAWQVLLYHPECLSCQQLIEQLAASDKQRVDTSIAVINVEPSIAHAPAVDPGGWAAGHLAPGRVWIVKTPQLLLLEDGVVLHVASEASAIKMQLMGGQP